MRTSTINKLIAPTIARPLKQADRKQLGKTLSFDLSGYNSTGSVAEELSRIELTIDPSWSNTLWARSLLFFANVGFKYGYYCNRIAQSRKEKTAQRKEAAFQQRESDYQQLAIETETAILRLQMNPHFIFNSMNSISSYIIQKDIDTANDYLARFAKLMRMILKFAAKPFIAVRDEIELLDLYLQTESMRFEQKFDYTFDLQEGFDPDEYIIPTMILQPFVENAIWHGLSNKKDKGHIHISFWREKNALYCSIADNGQGRAASTQNQQTKKHESKALSLTERRLSLLEPKNGITASFKTLDLYDDAQKPAGTKVELRFPVL